MSTEGIHPTGGQVQGGENTAARAHPLSLLAAGAYGLGLVLWFSQLISTRIRWDGDVVNRAVVEGYAKGREVIIFLVACAVVPLSCLLAFQLGRHARTGGGRIVLVILAHCALFAWPILALGGGLGMGMALGLCGGLYALLMVACVPRRRADEVVRPPHTPQAALRHDTASTPGMRRDASSGILGMLLLAGIGVAALIVPRVNPEFEGVRLATLVITAVGIAMVAAAWALVSRAMRELSPHLPVRQLAAGSLLPLSGLAVLYAGPSSAAFRAAVIGGALSFVMLCLAVGPRVHRRLTGPWTRRGTRWVGRAFWWAWVPTILYCTSFVRDMSGPIDLYHEGERITPAAALAAGAAPYREVFLWHGLAENGLVPQIGLVREWSVHGARVIEHVIDPLATLGIYALLASCLGSAFGGLAASLVVVFTFPSPYGRYWLAFLTYAALTRWLVRGGTGHRTLVVGGALLALSVFYSLDGGVAAAVASVATLAYGATILSVRQDGAGAWWRAVGAFLAGCAVGAAVPVAYLVSTRSFGAFLSSAADIVAGLSDRSSKPFPPLLVLINREAASPIDLFRSKALALYVPPLVIVWGLAHVVVRRIQGVVTGSVLALPAVLAGAAAFFRAVIRRPDMDHVGKILPLVYVVLVVLIVHHARQLRFRRRRVWECVAHGPVLAVLLVLGIRIAAIDPETAPAKNLMSRLRGPGAQASDVRQVRLARAGEGVTADSETASWVEHVVQYLSDNLGPDETFYDFTNHGLFYFLADRPCPSRFAQTTYAASQRAQREVIGALDASHPRLVLFPSGDPRKYGYDWLIHPFRHPIITRYLYRNYVPSALIDDTIILERIDPAASIGKPTETDLMATMPFVVDLGHIPVLLGELPHASISVQRWPASDIVATWRGTGRLHLVESHAHSAESDVASGPSWGLTSPRLSIDPEAEHTLVLRIGCDRSGSAWLRFCSAQRDTLDGSAEMAFYVDGDAALHTYMVDVGLLPAWIWRGPITRLQIEFPKGSREIRIEAIELRSYDREDQADVARVAAVLLPGRRRGSSCPGMAPPPHHTPKSGYDQREERA